VSGRDRFAQVLRTPGVARLLAAAVVARLPMGIDGLAIVLFVQERTGSFGRAGVVAGAFALAIAVTGPVQGRLVDHHGHARVLLPLAACHAVALSALIALGLAGAPTGVLVACSAVAGGSLPPVGSVVRPLLPRLLADAPELLPAAYALDSVLIEIAFVTGPLVVAAAIAAVSAAGALVAACVLAVAGTVALVTAPASRAWRPDPAAERHVLGPLVAPGVRTIVLVTMPVGFALGTTEVALPAFATNEGERWAAGMLLAIWSLGSAAGGLLYGARHHGRGLPATYVRLAALLPLTLVPLLAAPSLVVMPALALLAGMGIAPLFAAGNQLVGEVAPPGSTTEAFTWPITALTLGLASGNAASGVLVDAAGWRAAVACGIAVAVVGGGLALGRRRTLRPVAV
jgi:MFS family permease